MPDPADPIQQEVTEVLESPLTARILKALVTWILSDHDSPVARRVSVMARAGTIYLASLLHAQLPGHDPAALATQTVSWILGSGAAISWVLHLFSERLVPKLNAWIDRKFPVVPKK